MQVNRVHRVSVSWLSQATVAHRDAHRLFSSPARALIVRRPFHLGPFPAITVSPLLFSFLLDLARSSLSSVGIDKGVVDNQQRAASPDGEGCVALLTRKSIHFYPERSMGEIDDYEKKKGQEESYCSVVTISSKNSTTSPPTSVSRSSLVISANVSRSFEITLWNCLVSCLAAKRDDLFGPRMEIF